MQPARPLRDNDPAAARHYGFDGIERDTIAHHTRLARRSTVLLDNKAGCPLSPAQWRSRECRGAARMG